MRIVVVAVPGGRRMSGYEAAPASWARSGRAYLGAGDTLADAVDRLHDTLVEVGQCFGSDGFVGRPAFNGSGGSVGFRVARDDLLARLVLVVNLVRVAGHGQIVTGVNYQDAENASAAVVAEDIQRAQSTLAKVAQDDVYQLEALPDSIIHPIPAPGAVRTALGLLEMLGLQCEWADGHSDKVARIHEALHDVSAALNQAGAALARHTNTVVAANGGEATDAYTRAVNSLAGHDGVLSRLSADAKGLGDNCRTVANTIAAAQLQFVYSAVFIVGLTLLTSFGPGGALLARIQIAFQGRKLYLFLLSCSKAVLVFVALDAAHQEAWRQEHLQHGWNVGETLLSAGEGVTMGVVAGGIEAGITRLAGRYGPVTAVADAMNAPGLTGVAARFGVTAGTGTAATMATQLAFDHGHVDPVQAVEAGLAMAGIGAFAKNGPTGRPGTPDWLTHRSRALGGTTEAWARDLPAEQRAAVEDVLAPDGIKRLNDGLHSDDPQVRAEAAGREQAAKEALGPFQVEGDTTVYARPADDHLTALAAGEDVTVGSVLTEGAGHLGSTEVVFRTGTAVDVSDLVGHRQVITWSDTPAHVLAEQRLPPEERIGTQEPARRLFLADPPAADAPPRAIRHLKSLATDLSIPPSPKPSYGLPKDYWEFRDKIALRLESGELYKVNAADASAAPSIRPLQGVHDFGVSGGSVDEFLRAHGLEPQALGRLIGNYRAAGHVFRSVTPLDDGVARAIANETLTPIIYPTGETRIGPNGDVHLHMPDSAWRIAVPDAEHVPSMPGRLGDDGIRRFASADDVARYGNAYLGTVHFSDVAFDDLGVVTNYQRTPWPYNTILRMRSNGRTPAELGEWWDGITPGAPLALFDDPMRVNYHSIIFSDSPELAPLRRDLLASESMGERLQYWQSYLHSNMHYVRELYVNYGHFPTVDELGGTIAQLQQLTDKQLPEGVATSRSLRSVYFMEGFDRQNPDNLKALENTVQVEPGFMSVSLGDTGYWAHTDAAGRYPYTLHLDLPAGTRGLCSAFNDMYEITLAPGTPYRITRVTVNPDGTTDLYGVVLPH
ncbi:ADP-ribosyltransferase [Actinoallomurus iriomotensis]|uniref:WXG100-like domain-containing protein n=1 Tax=Actinoallomurus iriomotensis TaxID=478107 RepID=UPI0025550CF6|nr:ADP-ribosyltransferase [Actinoallomurus iriomotensis]